MNTVGKFLSGSFLLVLTGRVLLLFDPQQRGENLNATQVKTEFNIISNGSQSLLILLMRQPINIINVKIYFIYNRYNAISYRLNDQ